MRSNWNPSLASQEKIHAIKLEFFPHFAGKEIHAIKLESFPHFAGKKIHAIKLESFPHFAGKEIYAIKLESFARLRGRWRQPEGGRSEVWATIIALRTL